MNFNLLKFLKPSVVTHSIVRNTGKYNPGHRRNRLYDQEDRVLVEGKISYYPRYKDEPLPSHDPPKMFRVTRVKPMKGQPHWERRIMRDMGLYKNKSVAVVKNIPEINANLWKIKHLVKIEPITFPYGEPTENDVNHTYLKQDGECIVVKEIGGEGAQKRLEAADEIFKDPKKLDGPTLSRDSRLKWLNYW